MSDFLKRLSRDPYAPIDAAYSGYEGGLIEPGNVDLKNRPIIWNDDGSISTVSSMSTNIGGREVLLPTIADGRRLTDDEAVNRFFSTGEHMGVFDTPENATAAAQKISRDQAIEYAFPARLAADPYAPIDGASVTRVDELGNGYDDWGNLIAPKLEAPQQTWGETALGVATAPVRLVSALLGSISPYQFPQSTSVPMNRAGAGQPITGGDPTGGGWQVPPIVSEGADALTAVGDAYTGKMAPEHINSRALGMAGFMMGGGGPALALERGLAQRGISSTADMIPTGVKDYGTAKYLNWKYPDEPAVDPRNAAQWKQWAETDTRARLRNNRADAVNSMNQTIQSDMDGIDVGMPSVFNDFTDDLKPLTPADTGYMNALLQNRRPNFDVIDGGLFSNSDSLPGVMAGATAGQETEDGYADGGRVGFNPKYLVLHDYGGNPANLDGVFNPYHVLVFPDGSKRYRYPDDPYGRKAPHAFRLNPESVGISYAGDVGSQPTAAAMETLRNEAKAVADMFPGIEAMGHGEAFQATRGTNRQASRDGRDIEEASWRSNILYGPPAPGQTQVASAPVPMSKRGLTSFAGLEPSTAPVVRALPSPARSLAAAEMDAEPIATAEDKPSSFDLTKLASLFAEPEQAQAPQVQFTPIQAFQSQGSPIQASTPYRGTFADGGQVRGLPDQSEPLHAGPLHSTVPGRTDHLPITVAAGSFVLPADIVSSLGEGNTNAGMETVSKMFPLPPVRRADGGRVPIAAAGGEYVIAPETVAALGDGDLETGHDLLDQFVRRTRAQNIQRLRALPGPEK